MDAAHILIGVLFAALIVWGYLDFRRVARRMHKGRFHR